MLAYEIPSYRLSAPSWMREAKFDIAANVPMGTTRQQFRLMQQNLLEERFDLRTHWETKEMRVYALVIAKGGSRLKESTAASPNVSIGSTGGITRMTFTGSPLEQLVGRLSNVPGGGRTRAEHTTHSATTRQ